MTDTSRPFVPPFCPRSDCAFHTSTPGWRWIRYGAFTRQASPQRIPRFRCVHCRRTFSTQTFSTTYYLKRPELLEPIAHRLLACSGYRQIAREARCAPTSVMGQAARLGRHALLFLTRHRPTGLVLEPLVIDGFESFAYSQYHPLHLNVAVGAETHYVYGLTHSPLRRKGTMTAKQKARRAELEREYGRPDPKAIERGVADLLRLAVPRAQPLTVRSDEHPAYPRAFRRLEGWSIRHERTPSVEARTPQNPLFPVNVVDVLLRHNGANHKRETIAFSKRDQSVVERAAVLLVWRNFVKPVSERRRGETPAMRLGLRGGPLSWRAVLKARLFPTREVLPSTWAGYYWGLVPTAEFGSLRRNTLKLAG